VKRIGSCGSVRAEQCEQLYSNSSALLFYTAVVITDYYRALERFVVILGYGLDFGKHSQPDGRKDEEVSTGKVHNFMVTFIRGETTLAAVSDDGDERSGAFQLCRV
jgi:hypothetical protein